MKTKVLLRRTEVIDDDAVLPRPKITQEVLLVGTEAECRAMLESVAREPRNQSTSQIEVSLYVTKWDGQKNYTSQTFTKNNGQRNIDNQP